MTRFHRAIKRTIDVLVAATSLFVLSPLIGVIALLVKFTSPGPALLGQQRLGWQGCPFTMFKFRTMHHGAPPIHNPDGSTFVSEKDQRLTHIGRFLRDYTLDEIPQLLNVLKGEMSVVGPRPDLFEQLSCYDDLMQRKLEVKPGMACLAMVHGRNSLPWRRRSELDIYYIEHQSLRFDFQIFFKSFVQLVLRKGVYSPANFQEEQPAKPSFKAPF